MQPRELPRKSVATRHLPHFILICATVLPLVRFNTEPRKWWKFAGGGVLSLAYFALLLSLFSRTDSARHAALALGNDRSTSRKRLAKAFSTDEDRPRHSLTASDGQLLELLPVNDLHPLPFATARKNHVPGHWCPTESVKTDLRRSMASGQQSAEICLLIEVCVPDVCRNRKVLYRYLWNDCRALRSSAHVSHSAEIAKLHHSQ
jgi:hypothetical protein